MQQSTPGTQVRTAPGNNDVVWCSENPNVVHTQRNIFESLLNQIDNQIVFGMHRFIWIQTDVRLDPNQLVHGKYNLIPV